MNTAHLGTWRLIRFETILEDGTEMLPYGPNAEGRITYTKDGFMSVQLWDPDRHKPGAEQGTDSAFFAYCGDWSLGGDEMQHHVHAATDPSWTGTIQVRRVDWVDERLKLRAEDVVFDGKRGGATLLWERHG
jgi:hypothetical protein